MGGRSNFNQTSYSALHDEEEKKLYQESEPLELFATGMGRVAARVRQGGGAAAAAAQNSTNAFERNNGSINKHRLARDM